MTVRSVLEIATYIRGLHDVTVKAATLAEVQTSSVAHTEAVKNAKAQFIGRNDRRLTGRTINSIFTEFAQEGTSPVPELRLGTRGIAHGAIHEFGGEIEPVKAQKLWIPVHKNAGKMTPREFIRLKAQDPSHYFINDQMAGRREGYPGGNSAIIPLFWRVLHVEMPERPYLRPAMSTATQAFVRFFQRQLGELLSHE